MAVWCVSLFMVPTFTMRVRVTVSILPLSGTITMSLLHEMWEVTASAVTDTLTTPTNNQQNTT